jgi:hypothetical protein
VILAEIMVKKTETQKGEKLGIKKNIKMVDSRGIEY